MSDLEETLSADSEGDFGQEPHLGNAQRRQMGTNCSHLMILGAQVHWKYSDGLALLLAAGALAAYILSLTRLDLSGCPKNIDLKPLKKLPKLELTGVGLLKSFTWKSF